MSIYNNNDQRMSNLIRWLNDTIPKLDKSEYNENDLKRWNDIINNYNEKDKFYYNPVLAKKGTKLINKCSKGIHIKKKNRGKFTEYCGGKVTQQCIQEGKNSNNPTIRKRATFAANARKWNK